MADLLEDGKSGHHDGRFFGLDGFEEGNDFFLDGVLVEDGTAVGDGFRGWGGSGGRRTATTEDDEGFEATDFDGETACLAENGGDEGEELVFDSGEVQGRKNDGEYAEGSID